MPDPIDILVGDRIRRFRTFRRVSQQNLGRVIGVTFQQVQKYERGTNRVSPSRLQMIAKALDTPIGSFFDQSGAQEATQAEAPRRDAIDLAAAYIQISDPSVRATVLTLIESLAQRAPSAQ